MSFTPSTISRDHAAAPLEPERADLSKSSAARLCALLASICLGAVLPILMVVANKSAPAAFAAGALLANAAAILAGAGAPLRRRYATLLTGPIAILAAVVLALFVASFAWSIDPSLTRRGLVEGVPELVFALGAAAAWPLVFHRNDVVWLPAGIVVAGLLILLERAAGMPLHTLLKERDVISDLKRSAIPLVLLLWPAIACCLARRRILSAVLVLASTVIGLGFAHSGAAAVALIAGIGIAIVARVAPKAAVGLVGVLLLAIIASGPFAGTLVSRFVTPETQQGVLREEHAEHRIRIWTAFEEQVWARPLLGYGFNASYKVIEAKPGSPPATADEPDVYGKHPHNVTLQMWVECGVAGALLAALCVGYALMRLARLPATSLAPRLGCLVSIVAIGLVWPSAWQAWWIAVIAVAILWFGRIAAEDGA